MSGFHYKNNIMHVDDVLLSDLAEKHGTPLYVYSASIIAERANLLKEALEKHLGSLPLIAFACKANSNIAILNLMASQGLGTDLVSGGELRRAIAAGVSPEKIVFSGVGKTDDEIELALQHNILQINVESAPELARIEYVAEKIGVVAPVAFRMNPNVDAETHAKITTGKSENKFGLSFDDILPLYEKAADRPHLSPRGLSMHIGSQLTKIKPFHAAFEKMAEAGQTLLDHTLPLESLDIGGGLGVVYDNETPPDVDEYAQAIKDIIQPLGTQIILEPGRFMAADCGVLLTQNIYTKYGETKNFAILDAGMNDLMRPSLYEAYHPINPVIKSDETEEYDFVGPVCETGDTFAKSRKITKIGDNDLIAIGMSGAYGFVMASNYNTRSLPAEILVEGDKIAVIRKRQEFDDIIKDEAIPDWINNG